MQLIFKIFIAAILIVIVFSSLARPVSFAPVYMKDVFGNADKVVLGRFIKKEEVFSAGSRKVKCGWLIDIEVDEAFKGGNEKFTFFTSDKDTFFEFADQYLVIASINNKFAAEGRSGTIYCDPYAGLMGASTKNSAYVNVSSYNYMANSFWDNGTVAIMPLDTLAATDYGGQWVRVPGHYKISTPALRREISVSRGHHGMGAFETFFLINMEELIEEAFGDKIP